MGPAVPDLHDDVVVLRPPREDDVDAITAAVQDPEIPRYTRIPSPYTRNDATQFVRAAIENWSGGRLPRVPAGDAQIGLSFMIVDRSDDSLIGGIGTHDSENPEVREIGYWVARDARRRGIATRAVRLLSRWAINELGLRRLELMTHVDNVASQGVAERAGFTREGVLRSYTTLGCGLADVVMFSLLPEDLTAPNG
ncbi:MAG: GNAT family N-acetyltransferase [Acidimicrobiia bacterium]